MASKAPAGHGNRSLPFRRLLAAGRAWWRDDVTEGVTHADVLKKIASESSLTPRYLLMTCMSAGIAILGLLQSSPAVVIGAMLLSPLMGPILGAGFALAEGKFTWFRLCGKALVVGTLVAVLFSAIIVWISPLQTVTSEIAARTRPNLFDLAIALFSSIAGSYAMIRGREGTIVGVAIATALMPPLAVVGFGLATLNMAVFGGALLLFVTNFLTIALTALVMARLYGFKSSNTVRHGLAQSLGILVVFIVLAIPLGISLRQIALESNGQRMVRDAIEDQFDPRARINQLAIDWDADPVSVNASVLTPAFRSGADDRVAHLLSRSFDEPVTVNISQYQVGTDPGAAEQAALAQARAQEQAAATEKQVTDLAGRLALVSGAAPEDVVIDRDNRRAIATAKPLPGLRLAGYRDLERRVGSGMADWRVELRPPLLQLPVIAIADGKPDAEGDKAIGLIAWAAARTGIPVELSGPDVAVEAATQVLAEAGIRTTRVSRGGDAVTARWLAVTQDD